MLTFSSVPRSAPTSVLFSHSVSATVAHCSPLQPHRAGLLLRSSRGSCFASVDHLSSAFYPSALLSCSIGPTAPLSLGSCSGSLLPLSDRSSGQLHRCKRFLTDSDSVSFGSFMLASSGAFRSRKEDCHASEPESIGANDENVTIKDGKHDNSHGEDDTNAETHDESESLSDIDDQEVDGYLHNEEEKHYKKIIWENMNREYLEEQAAKEAAEAAKKDFDANCSDEFLSVREAAAKSKKEARQRRAQEAKNSGPAQSAAEATSQMFRAKRLSSKVNYDRLGEIFGEPAASENPKKVRFELPSDNADNLESKLEDKMMDDEFEDGDYENTLYNENADETYEYDYNYGDDGYHYDDY